MAKLLIFHLLKFQLQLEIKIDIFNHENTQYLDICTEESTCKEKGIS